MGIPVVVLVGGQGTRLQPLTRETPKQLVPILNIPMLEHNFLHLRRFGITRVTLASAAREESIQSAFGDGGRLGIQLTYVDESTPLGSGGAIANVTADWSEPFLVLNGDIITDLDMDRMMAFHRSRRADLTIALHEVEDPTGFGVVAQDAGCRITRFVEKPALEDAPSRWINAGAWLFERPLLGTADAGHFHRVEDELFPRLASQGGPIFGFRHAGYWLDVGTLATYRQANADALRGTGPCRQAVAWPEGGICLDGAVVEPGAQITGPVIVGAGSVIRDGARVEGPVAIGRDCLVEESATITESTLWNRVRVGRGARVEGSILATGADVGAGAQLHEAVLAHRAVVAPGAEVSGDTHLQPDVRFP
jgi:mannose-1-phosphate guanylyltransferase